MWHASLTGRSDSATHRFAQSRQAGLLAMGLFLASLTVLFVAALVGYGIIRWRLRDALPLGEMSLPPILFASTALLLAAGVLLEVACRAVQRERQQKFKVTLAVAAVLTVGFVVLQGEGMFELLQQHEATAVQRRAGVFGLAFAIVVVHALHVVGGLVPLAVVTLRAFRGGYDHEAHLGVRQMAMYWHFLDVVWLVTLGFLAVLA